MKAELDVNGNFFQFQPDNYDFGNPEHPHKLVKINGFSFYCKDDEDVKYNRCYINKVCKFTIDKDGIIHKKTQQEIKATPEYQEQEAERLMNIELKKMAYENVKKAKPELASVINKKIGDLK